MIINAAVLVVGDDEQGLLLPPFRSAIGACGQAFTEQDVMQWVLIVRHAFQKRIENISAR